jgi:adenosylcobinamide kinase/adenosylcobinamide-phosphate guanylyltransferase
MDARLSLILGGVRSGKSEFAERLARELDKPAIYVATGLPTDAEMERRIRRHRESRPAGWGTLEEPLDLAGCLTEALGAREPPGVVLIDSLDLWVGNLVRQHEGESFDALESLTMRALGRLLKVCRHSSAALFLVSCEVGLSLVSPYPLGRRFQDLLGLVNQKVATAADRVYLVVAGIPVELKGPARV